MRGFRRIASLALLASFVTANCYAQWSSEGRPVPDEPWRKADGDFGAMIMITDRPSQFEEDWNKPDTPHIRTVTDLNRNTPAVAFIIFTGCTASSYGNCNGVVDFVIVAPDGSQYGKESDVPLWKDMPPPPKGNLQLSMANLGVVIEPQDQSGTYTIRATVKDLVAGKKVEVEEKFTVKE